MPDDTAALYGSCSGREGRRALRIGAERATTINDGDTPLFGLDHEPLKDAVAGERDQVARIERKHLLVAPEPSALTQAAVETEGDLGHL